MASKNTSDEKIDKLNSFKIKCFHESKDTTNKVKEDTQNGRKYLQIV